MLFIFSKPESMLFIFSKPESIKHYGRLLALPTNIIRLWWAPVALPTNIFKLERPAKDKHINHYENKSIPDVS